MLKLDHFFLSKNRDISVWSPHLISKVTSFYQRGRGSALRGKWVISSQIRRGRWRISRMRRLVLPFKWAYFHNTRPRERLSTFNSRQGIEGRMLSPGESVLQHLLNKASLGYDIRGMSTPSRLGEDIWIRAPKFGSQARPNCNL